MRRVQEVTAQGIRSVVQHSCEKETKGVEQEMNLNVAGVIASACFHNPESISHERAINYRVSETAIRCKRSVCNSMDRGVPARGGCAFDSHHTLCKVSG